MFDKFHPRISVGFAMLDLFMAALIKLHKKTSTLEEVHYKENELARIHDNYIVYWLRTCVVEFINSWHYYPLQFKIFFKLQ